MRLFSAFSKAASALRSSRRASAAVISLAALVLVAGVVPLGAALAQPGTSSSSTVTEDFQQGVLVRPDWLITVEGFTPGDLGWYLAPGASGRFVYRIPSHSGSAIGVYLWVYAYAGVTNTVSVGAPGLPTIEVAANVNYLGNRLVLPTQYSAASSLDVQIDAHNASASRELVINKLVSDAVQGSDPRAPPAYSYLAFGCLVGLIAFAAVRRHPKAMPVAIGIGLVAAVAAASRVIALFLVNLPPAPDALAYRTYADRFQWWPLFDNGIFSGNFLEREPLFPMVVHIYFQVLGSSDYHLRVVSATLSIAVVIVSIVAARRRLQTWWAPILVGLAIATTGPLIEESANGLRLELETLVVIGLYLALDRMPARRPVMDAGAVGLIGAAMALTRTYFIAVFVAAVAISFLIRYRSLPRVMGLIGIAVLIMGAAEAAHRVGMYEHTQNAFWDTAGYARWNANEELFTYHRPLPHVELFPSLSQFQNFGPYTGPSITSLQYLFEIHTPMELARDSLAGVREIFDSMNSFVFDVQGSARLSQLPTALALRAASIAARFDQFLRWTVLLGLMGMIVRAFREPRLLIIPTMVMTWVGMTAFLFDHSLLEQYRHTWQVYPLALIAGAWLVERVATNRRWRQLVNIDSGLLAAVVVLALAEVVLPHSVRLFDVALAAGGIGILTYRRPVLGFGALLLAMSPASWSLGAAAAAASLTGILARARPGIRALIPLGVLAPLATVMMLGGGAWSTGSLEVVVSMVGVTTATLVVFRRDGTRNELLWMLAALGPLAGVAYCLQPPAFSGAELAPVGAVAAAWLFLNGQRWALALGLFDAALVVLVLPLAAWLGVAAAVVLLAAHFGRLGSTRRRLALAGALAAGLAILTAGASLAGTTPRPVAGWTVQLDAAGASVEQQITVDRAGDTSLWVYARRASALTDYPSTVTVNGNLVTSDLNSYLLTDPMAWARIPLPAPPGVGDRLDVRIVIGGAPNAVDRYLELGGVYATVDGISSPGANGTYLIVLGDDSLPLAPGGLPEPMVRNRLQPPMGEWMAGELRWQTDSREQASVLAIWQQTLSIVAQHPLGVGTGSFANVLVASHAGFGPGLSARSEFLQALAEWGWPGLVALLLAIAFAAWRVLRTGDRFAAALLICVAISMVGESVISEPASAATVWLAIGLCLAASASRATSPSTSQASAGETPPAT